MFSELKRLIKIFRIKVKRKKIYFMEKANIDKSAKFEGQNKIGMKSWFEGYMGYGTYIGDDCIIKAKIGKYCSIGHKVTVLTGTHPSHKFVSTHPMFFSLEKQNGGTYVKEPKFKEKVYFDEKKGYGVIIGNDVWIGYGVTIMGGCKIGDGAIIASGALVREDVKPYTIVAGQPAKIIGQRFTNAQIEWLLDFKWWNRDENWISKNVDKFEDIEKFIDLLK